MKRISLLGSTGSIGVNALDLVARFPDTFRVAALSAGRNVGLLCEQARRHRPEAVALLEEDSADEFRRSCSDYGGEVLWGSEGICRIATWPGVSHVVAGIVGSAGLLPTWAAIREGRSVALANKEVLVAAGPLIMEEAARSGGKVLPIDSEHSAIFQAIQGNRREDIRRLWLTASGGPFVDTPIDKLAGVTPAEALRHPNWEMGPKITIDSATMMNKGLEIIEARWLFAMRPEDIGVVVHRQSIIHSMVEFRDGSLIAQMGLPDM
ncbi:MAG: 1-deoxy-D-xylulose-5-phosphate reductoisomerase, partial [Vicinamibacteria bacterium]